MAKARRRGRGLAGIARNPKDLYYQVKSCGSHFFDPSTRRFFNSKVLATYPVHNRNVTYFVEARGGKSDGFFSMIPRHYKVGVFKNCQVEMIGKDVGGRGKGAYTTAAKAKKVAKAIADKAWSSGGNAPASSYTSSLGRAKSRKRRRR